MTKLPCTLPACTLPQIREKLDEARRELEAMQGSVVGSESEEQMRVQQLATKVRAGREGGRCGEPV